MMKLSPSTLRPTISHLPDGLKLQLLQQFCGWINDSINMRAHVADCVEDGQVGIIVSSTDCDWSHSTYSHVLPVRELDGYIQRLLEGAEGPTSYHVCPPSVLTDFVPSHRDFALEAFEDGHAHCIHA